ncbi:MAG: SMP-30/gluconolactonase/LRE family protein [Nannocystaceae bacterium]|nr:SMP-30/gluconolactonase/LRE family protein [Nannocystaceae bacterium]
MLRLLPLCLPGCMTAPGVEVLDLPSTAATFTVAGWVLHAEQEIVIECHRPADSVDQWKEVATVQSSDVEDGVFGLFGWSGEVSLPEDCWRPAQPGRSTTLVRARSTGDDARWLDVIDDDCLSAAIAGGQPVFEAAAECTSRRAYAPLLAPSEITPGSDPLDAVAELPAIILGGAPAIDGVGAFGHLDAVRPVGNAIAWHDAELDAIDSVTLTLEGGAWLGYELHPELPSPLRPAGSASDDLGRQLAASYTQKTIYALSYDSQAVATDYDGVPFNGPADLVGHRLGPVYFTDPLNGMQPRFGGTPATQPFQGVYVLVGDGLVQLVDATLEDPNGVALSPDHTWLYVSDRTKEVIYRYPLDAQGLPAGAREFFAEAPEPDGLEVDVDGNLYVAAAGGVVVFAPDGAAWGELPLDGDLTDLCFCHEDLQALCVVGDGFLRRFAMPIPGAPAPL